MPTIKDTDGRTWEAKRVGRTSGIVSGGDDPASIVEPADLVRFSCTDAGKELARETVLKVGLLEKLSDPELLELLERSVPV